MTKTEQEQINEKVHAQIEKVCSAGGRVAGIVFLVPCTCGGRAKHEAMELQWGTTEPNTIKLLNSWLVSTVKDGHGFSSNGPDVV